MILRKTVFSFCIIALCLIIYSCDFSAFDFEAQEKDRKCKRDYLDSINKNNKYWIEARQNVKRVDYEEWKIIDLVDAIDDMKKIDGISCKEFKSYCDSATFRMEEYFEFKNSSEKFVDTLKAIDRRYDSIKALRLKKNN